MNDGEKLAFLNEIEKSPPLREFFAQFQSGELFSDDLDILHQCFEKMRHFPKEFIEYNSKFDVSLLTKYLSIVLPPSITDLLVSDLFYFLDKIPSRDLNFIIPAITSHFSLVQKSLAVYNFPDCSATFIFLSSLFDSDDFFDISFQRIYSSYSLVPIACKPFINSALRQSIQNGPARDHFPGIFDIALNNYSKQKITTLLKKHYSILEIILNAIIDGFPTSCEKVSKESLNKIIENLLEIQRLPFQVLKFFKLIEAYPILSQPQLFHFISECPDILFDYIKSSPPESINEMWKTIMAHVHQIPMLFPHHDVLLSIYKNFFLLTIQDSAYINLISQPNIEWFQQFINSMTGDPRDIALFGIYLLFLRCFDVISMRALNDANLYAAIETAMEKTNDKIAFADVIFFSFDLSRKCPFESLTNFDEITEISFPPPSPAFIFRIVPILINAIMKVSTDAITKSNHPNNQGILSTSSISSPTVSPRSSKSFSCLSSSEDDFLSINEELVISSFVKYIIENLLPMYENDELVVFLYSISTAQNLMPFLDFALSDEKCFVFLARALGLSCPFLVFQKFFKKISSDLPKTINFLSNLVEYSQIVTDYIYVTNEIPMNLSTSSTTIALWVRPHAKSTLLSLVSNKCEFSVIISKTTINVPHHQEIQLPPKIGGWLMICFTFLSSNTLLVSVNLTTIKIVFPNDAFPCPGFKIGGPNSFFDLQSVRVFRNFLNDDDLLYLFSLGPNYNELICTDFNAFSSYKLHTFVTEKGFISQPYLPFIKQFSKQKKFESNLFNMLEYVFAPPFKNIRHISKINTSRESMNISLDRRRSLSFMNSLHCHGGLYIIIHFIGEVIMKYPSLNHQLFIFLSKFLNNYPSFNVFLEEKHAYALIGHLMWSGNTPACDTFNLALKKQGKYYYLTNPGIIKHWLFEAQLYYSEMDDVIEKLMLSLEIPRNFSLLTEANTFEKIVNLLCGTCSHTESFFNKLAEFAVKLTTAETAEENAKLVFDRLILCHFVFSLKEELKNSENETNSQENPSQESNKQSYRSKLHMISLNHTEIKPINTVYLIRILLMILNEYKEVNVELELFLSAIITSVPIVQAEIVGILLKHMKFEYLHLLSFVLKQLPYIEELTKPIFNHLENGNSLSFVRMTTSMPYLILHEECKEFLVKLCSHAKIDTSLSPDEASIAFNQVTESIAIIEQSTDYSDFDDNSNKNCSRTSNDSHNTDHNANNRNNNSSSQDVALDSQKYVENVVIRKFISFMIYQAISLGKIDLVSLFYYAIYTIPNVPTSRLVSIIVFFMDKSIRLVLEHPIPNLNFDKVIESSTGFVSFLVHKVRLTPGALNDKLMNLLENYSESIISLTKQANSSDATSYLIVYLIALFHIELQPSFIRKISNSITDVPKIQKQKRYQEMIDRMEGSSDIAPVRFSAPYPAAIEQIEKNWKSYSEVDRIGLFSLSCRSIHHQTVVSNLFQMNDPDSDYVIDLWHDIFHALQFPGSFIYSQCPTKWMVSDRSFNYQQRRVLLPINPSIDKLYDNFWETKYGTKAPIVRLKLHEVLQYTPISLHNAKDVLFSSHAIRLYGMANYDGVFIVTKKKIRFYQRQKDSSEFCEDFVTIQISKIEYIKLKTFRHQQTGVEIICADRTCYIFSFDTVNLRDLFIERVTLLNAQIVKSINMKEVEIMTKKWVDGTISNFDYLLYLNSQGGRSWNDFTQYPIFPWVIKKYNMNNLDLNDNSSFRDMTLPIFAQSTEQQEQCMAYFRTTSALSGDGHCTPNYFSNVGSTLYFLVRLEPFTDEEIGFQGGTFDAADRTFQSFEISYALMIAPGNKNALELVPEFYFNPEALKNVNNIKFPNSILSKRVVDDIALPPWAKFHRDLVHKFRMALESPYISQSLNEWIDLVWGFRRRGDAALERFNAFQNTVFEFNMNDVIDDRVLFKAMRDQIHNCGQAAHAIFKAPHPKRNPVLNNIDIRGQLIYQTTKKTTMQKKGLKFTINPDGWTKLDNDKTSINSIRVSQGSLDLMQSSNIIKTLTFSDEIAITCFDVMKSIIITGHVMPVINIWKLREEVTMIHSLRGHMSRISVATFFSENWSIIAAGHDDGCVSLFSMNPMRFLRLLKTEINTKVTMIKINDISGDLLVAQHRSLTLWSVNGERVNTISIESEPCDAVFTNFTDGMKTNFIFLLCENGVVMTLNSYDLDIVCVTKVRETREKPISLCFKTDILYVQHSDSAVTCWKNI
ncbi:Beige/BEACH domain containing protein [Tritrichomonas foetus]|uniref:Beige/BEACH domain containing protein n=1 Tax=Tritrichomonas foetus TaxID=1144522 RepID=A0A1J4KRR8_9EUKA|nr:Beige/BEACH domain containing protein [Tritrichomonas foetus]|eukprot:OHT13967.1 Beige/BEACH domain containing protein [Tritrichomonas foetus]